MAQEHSVGIILFNKEQYLLLRYASGHWGYVKGNVEGKEEAEETARRELKEETGITTVFFVKGFLESEEYFYKKEGKTVHKRVEYFLGETQETEVTLSKEHKDFAWLSYQEAINRLSFAAGKELLRKAEEFKRYH